MYPSAPGQRQTDTRAVERSLAVDEANEGGGGQALDIHGREMRRPSLRFALSTVLGAKRGDFTVVESTDGWGYKHMKGAEGNSRSCGNSSRQTQTDRQTNRQTDRGSVNRETETEAQPPSSRQQATRGGGRQLWRHRTHTKSFRVRGRNQKTDFALPSSSSSTSILAGCLPAQCSH